MPPLARLQSVRPVGAGGRHWCAACFLGTSKCIHFEDHFGLQVTQVTELPPCPGDEQSGSGGSNTGAIVGGVVGGVAAVARECFVPGPLQAVLSAAEHWAAWRP